MTKQKMYEIAVMETYRCGGIDEIDRELKLLGKLPDTFSELLLMRSAYGFRPEYPRRHPFDRLGISYVVQLGGFAVHNASDEFRNAYIDFLNSNVNKCDFLDMTNDENVSGLYDVFYESITANKDFAMTLGDFLFANCRNSRLFKDIFSLIRAFGLIDKTSIAELNRVGREMGFM